MIVEGGEKVSLRGDPIAVVVLPPGVSADDITVEVVFEQDVPNAWAVANGLATETGRSFRKVERKTDPRRGPIVAIIVETEST